MQHSLRKYSRMTHAEPSPESFQIGGLCVSAGGFGLVQGLDTVKIDKNSTDL